MSLKIVGVASKLVEILRHLNPDNVVRPVITAYGNYIKYQFSPDSVLMPEFLQIVLQSKPEAVFPDFRLLAEKVKTFTFKLDFVEVKYSHLDKCINFDFQDAKLSMTVGFLHRYFDNLSDGDTYTVNLSDISPATLSKHPEPPVAVAPEVPLISPLPSDLARFGVPNPVLPAAAPLVEAPVVTPAGRQVPPASSGESAGPPVKRLKKTNFWRIKIKATDSPGKLLDFLRRLPEAACFDINMYLGDNPGWGICADSLSGVVFRLSPRSGATIGDNELDALDAKLLSFPSITVCEDLAGSD